MFWWPRSIRRQLLAGQVLLMLLTLTLFAMLVARELRRDVREHTESRLTSEAEFTAVEVAQALSNQRPEDAKLAVTMMGKAPSVALTKVTDPAGRVTFASRGDAVEAALIPAELAQIAQVKKYESRVFSLGGGRYEAVKAVYANDQLRGYVWVEANRIWDRDEINRLIPSTIEFGLIWLLASALLVVTVTRTISDPLKVLRDGAKTLIQSPHRRVRVPLPVGVHNEVGDLIVTFNQMIVSIEEQREGLNDTLSLLDSMLANAPIGLAFFDRRCRMVRVNQVFADMSGLPLSSHLGRTLPELLPQPVALRLEETILGVFTSGAAMRNLELSSTGPGHTWTWLASAYPVLGNNKQVRWVGAILLDSSEQRRSEEALRKTEKLAATGRLAASIAHEINNPLEAITNLLFLLHNFSQLEGQPLEYVLQAEHEARRISEITQQTLRFYRQPSHPARANLAELLDSVLSLYQGRLHSFGIEVERDYDAALDLFCFAGELRQVFANLIGNAIDASTSGGRIVVRARRSSDWKEPARKGIRFTVADTGSGMEPAVRAHIFEAFFTTKEATGTGLGLWVSHGIIVKHEGLIHLRSRTARPERSAGTVFQIFLPDNFEQKTDASPEGSAKIEETAAL
jgi:signal transduction histidine kinase